MRILVTLISFALLATTSFGGDAAAAKDKKDDQKIEAKPDSTQAKEQVNMDKLKFITTESGLRYADVVVGKGNAAAVGDSVECHYTLWAADEKDRPGKLIQSSKQRGQTFEFRVGGRLIKGWNEGMVGMKEGGTRMLIVPPKLGYGDGAPQHGKNLIFKIEYLKTKGKGKKEPLGK